MPGPGGPGLHRVEMDVRAAFDFRGQRRQFEVVRGEQREAAVVLGEPVRDRPRQRQAVEGRRAAADLVDQHEALRRRAVQDVRGLRHLDHERRAPAGEVVGGADPRVDRIERPEPRAARPARTFRSTRAARSPRSGACTSTCRPCSGPVTISSLRVGIEPRSLGMNASTWRSTTGWRPPSIATQGPSTNSRPRQLAARRHARRASRARRASPAPRPPPAARRWRGRAARAGRSNRRFSGASARSCARQRLRSSNACSSGVM